MIPNNPVAEFLAWLLFALLLIWAMWKGFWDFVQGMRYKSDGREDIHFFPDEVGSEPGQGILAGSGGDPGRRRRPALRRGQVRRGQQPATMRPGLAGRAVPGKGL
jgi:hypothetical protein